MNSDVAAYEDKKSKCFEFIWHYEITVIIVYVMIWVVWIIPSIVYCVALISLLAHCKYL